MLTFYFDLTETTMVKRSVTIIQTSEINFTGFLFLFLFYTVNDLVEIYNPSSVPVEHGRRTPTTYKF